MGAILDYVAEADVPAETDEDEPQPSEEPVAPKAPKAEPTLAPDLVQPHVLNESMLDRREGAMAMT